MIFGYTKLASLIKLELILKLLRKYSFTFQDATSYMVP